MQSRVLAILIAVVLALVATAALVVYVNGADRRAIADQEPVVVLVAKETIKAGTSGEDAETAQADRREDRYREPSAVPGAFRAWSQLEGKFAAVDIVKGEQLLPIALGRRPRRSPAGGCCRSPRSTRLSRSGWT